MKVCEDCPGLLTKQEWEYWAKYKTTHIQGLFNTKTRKDLAELWQDSLVLRL